MDQRFRRGFTAAEKTQLWDRWQRGESLKAIGRAFGKPSSSIYYQLAPHGGIRPPLRRRSRLALTLAEREEISRGIAAHQSARSMARLLGRSASTVSRELKRNGGYDGYRAALADETAWARARRPKRCKLANSARLRQAVASKLRLNWSPEQVADLSISGFGPALSLNPSNSQISIIGFGLNAIADELVFNFGDPEAGFFKIYSDSCYPCGVAYFATAGLNYPNPNGDFYLTVSQSDSSSRGGNPIYESDEEIIGIATPLPAALPLFATGLGALGLLLLRGKRKAAAIAA